MVAHDDADVIYMTSIIDDQRESLANFKTNITLDDHVSITMQLRESVYEKIESILESGC